MSEITRTPLCWPNNVPRTAPHNRGTPNFTERSIAIAVGMVRAEINRLNQRHWDYSDESVIVSSNLRLRLDGLPRGDQGEPIDTGIAVYFQLRFVRNGKWYERPTVLTCDKWRKTCDNLVAIAKDIEAQRARNRWGCTNVEQAFRGYLAIPEKCGGDSWWVLLNVPSTASEQQIKDRFKELAKSAHPDVGGDREAWDRLQNAYDQAMAGFRKAA
jgi:hypothetical protein